MENIPLTSEYKRRLIKAITETYELLEREMNHMQHRQDQKLITFYKQHILKLEEFLKAGHVQLGE